MKFKAMIMTMAVMATLFSNGNVMAAEKKLHLSMMKIKEIMIPAKSIKKINLKKK